MNAFEEFKKNYMNEISMEENDPDYEDELMSDYEGAEGESAQSAQSDEEEEEEENEKKVSDDEYSNSNESSSSYDSSDDVSSSLDSITHIYISINRDQINRLLCYGFNKSSTPFGTKIVNKIHASLNDVEYDDAKRYTDDHKFLINRLVEMAFYDSSDEDRFTRSNNERWFDMSQRLFGTILTSSDVGVWERLSEKDITDCGFVVSTLVCCDEV